MKRIPWRLIRNHASFYIGNFEELEVAYGKKYILKIKIIDKRAGLKPLPSCDLCGSVYRIHNVLHPRMGSTNLCHYCRRKNHEVLKDQISSKLVKA